jgi:hypothetical protein
MAASMEIMGGPKTGIEMRLGESAKGTLGRNSRSGICAFLVSSMLLTGVPSALMTRSFQQSRLSWQTFIIDQKKSRKKWERGYDVDNVAVERSILHREAIVAHHT